ncbi:MAG: hypothetical protein KC708_04090 [Anaerolineae bacterium]|nr:hypothetical protein [Anaerolineae bacterium]
MPKNKEISIAHLGLLNKLRKAGRLKDPRIEAAFRQVPRHLFLPGLSIEQAYADEAIPLKKDPGGLLVSSASQPTMMSIMLEQLDLQPGDNVLEIGTASGYNAALMRYLVDVDGHVTTVEIDKDLADQATRNLQMATIIGIQVVHADGVLGYAPRAAYDAIIATAGVWDVPEMWKRQLKKEGRIVAPIWLDGVQVSARFDLQPDGTLLSTDNRPCAFVYLRGEAAGPDMRRRVGSTSLYLISEKAGELDTIALHTLLSDDHEYCNLEQQIDEYSIWYGLQLYLMLYQPEDVTFALYAIIEGQQAYGMEGRGIALFDQASAMFLPYDGNGQGHCFAGADALFRMQAAYDEWDALGKPRTESLRVRLIPRNQEPPTEGRVYTRREHYVQVWLETTS